jgi:hypothetical protein
MTSRSHAVSRLFNPLSSRQNRLGRLLVGSLCLAGALATLSPAAQAQRFTPAGNGRQVTDTETGLTWLRCAVGQRWTGSACTGTATAFDWPSALAYAQAYAAQTGVAWRLPNVKEQLSLVETGTHFPALDPVVFDQQGYDRVWTSTPSANNPQVAWTVEFFEGTANLYELYAQAPIHLVRGR